MSKFKKVALILGTIALIWGTSYAQCDKNVMFNVALDKVISSHKISPILTNSTPINELSQHKIDKERSQIACVREWVKTLTDNCQKEGFNEVLNAYSRLVDDAERTLKTGKIPMDMYDIQDQKAKEYMRTHKIPNIETKCHE